MSRLVSVLLQISVHIGTALTVLGSAIGDAILNDGVTKLGGETNAAVAVARKTPKLLPSYTQTYSLSFFIDKTQLNGSSLR